MTSALLIVKSNYLDDWYVVVDERGRSPVWASIEGTGVEMKSLCEAVLRGEAWGARRCAVSAPVDGRVRLWSPRNEVGEGASATTSVVQEMARTFLAHGPRAGGPDV